MTTEAAPAAGYFTPILHVADIERSIAFYRLLGFRVVDTDRSTPLGWARLHCEGGALMFLRAEAARDASTRAASFYMYTPDLPGLRQSLIAHGVVVPPIRFPEYMLSGEINLSDPDGYHIGIGHWGEAEHTAWLARLASAT